MAINTMIGGNAGPILTIDRSVVEGDLAAGGQTNLIVSSTGNQFRILNIVMNYGGTNFSGGGDRDITITDGVTIYTIMPAAVAQSLVNAQWGSASLPFNAFQSMNILTAPGDNLYAIYSSGSLDYSAGSVVLTITYQRIV